MGFIMCMSRDPVTWEGESDLIACLVSVFIIFVRQVDDVPRYESVSCDGCAHMCMDLVLSVEGLSPQVIIRFGEGSGKGLEEGD